MWCDWGFAGRGMWWPHFVGPLVFLLLFVLLVLAVYLIWKKRGAATDNECPACNGRVQTAYLRCPHCGVALKRHCPRCSGIIEAGWNFCPVCEAEITGENDGKTSD